MCGHVCVCVRVSTVRVLNITAGLASSLGLPKFVAITVGRRLPMD